MNAMYVAQLLTTEVNQSDGRGRLEEDAWDGSRAYARSHIWHHESNAYPIILEKGKRRVQGVVTHIHKYK